MPIPHIEEIKKLDLPIVSLFETGNGFRVNGEFNGDFQVENKNNEWLYFNETVGLQVIISYQRIDNVLILSSKLLNISKKTISGINTLEPLHLIIRNPANAWRHIYANGGTTEWAYPPQAFRTQEWTRHMPFFNQNNARQLLKIESHPAGQSSNLHLPLIISLLSISAESDGLFCGLEWSGTWYLAYQMIDEVHVSLSAGIKVNGLSLNPGEELALPNVHLGFFKGGPETGTNELRKYIYDHVCPRYQNKPVLPPVSYDSWYGIGNEGNFEILKTQAKHAAELGVEVFCVDCNWVPGGFPDGVGNLDHIDLERFPDGLEPLAKYVRSLGMKFGMWIEIERAIEGTQIVREHPEWWVPVPHPRRKEYHLNLAIREAQDFMIDLLGSYIKRLDLHWSRWDYNIEPMHFWKSVDPTLKIQFGYINGLYRVLDTLMRQYPNWMIESTASGGRRIDLGTIRRAHTYWISDQSEIPASSRYQQARANRFLPGQLLNSSVVVRKDADFAYLDNTSILSHMLGKMAVDGYISLLPKSVIEDLSKRISDFKSIRHLVVQNFFQLLPQPQTIEDWDAVQFLSYSADEGLLYVFSGSTRGEKHIKFKGLVSKTNYELTEMVTGTVFTSSGRLLMEEGQNVRLEEYKGEMWYFRKCI